MWHNPANKFFDALAAAKPLMINYGGWQAELLRQTGAGLVLGPSASLADANEIVSAINDQEWLSAAAAASKEPAISRFDRERHAEQLILVLEKAVRGQLLS